MSDRESYTLSARESRQSADPERLRPPRPPSPSPPQENTPPPAEEVTKLRLTAHYASLVLSTMVGCLIRLGLTALASYDGRVIFPLAWCQGVGCGIMGLALARKNEIVAWYPPLYTFWTTGVAGSVTTFSTWMEEGYIAFANFDNYSRGGLYDTVDGLAYSFSTLAISIACLHLGKYVSTLLPALPRRSYPRNSDAKPESHDSISNGVKQTHPRALRHLPTQNPWLDVLAILTAVLSYLIALLLYFLGPVSWRHRATFPILLSPPGTILRFALAKLNTRRPFLDRFPLGTFIANMTASLILGGVFAQQHRVGSGVTCNALYAIQQGFCGCLSTVSTFAVEARTVRRWWKLVYVLGSVILGHLLVLATLGGSAWSRGLGPLCTE